MRGHTVREAMGSLVEQFPTLKVHLYKDDETGGHSSIYSWAKTMSADLQGMDTSLSEILRLVLIPSISRGGVDPILPGLTREEILRYSRHLLISEVGLEGQRRLKGSSVLLLGPAGLVRPVALYLAAAGVGRIGLVDGRCRGCLEFAAPGHPWDRWYWRPESRFSPAAYAGSKSGHRSRNCITEPFTSENAMRIAQAYDLLVDGTDNFPTRYLTNDAPRFLGKPNVECFDLSL